MAARADDLAQTRIHALKRVCRVNHLAYCRRERKEGNDSLPYPNILVIDNRNGGTTGQSVGARKLGNMWHSDSSYLTEPLPLTFLHAQRVPDGEGQGDTLFVDMQEALRTLQARLRERIEGRQAKHDVRWTYKVKQSDLGESVQEIFQRLATTFPAVSHPTIVRHRHTGRDGPLRVVVLNRSRGKGLRSAVVVVERKPTLFSC